MRNIVAGLVVGMALLLATSATFAKPVICLIPAPFQPGLAPAAIAKQKGFYKEQDLDVEFIVAKGGVDVAKQVGAGNASFGLGMGDTPIIVRPNGVPVKSVAVFGSGGLTQLISRAGSGIASPADLKGKSVTVISYQDTTYYALLGMLASAGLTKSDVSIRAVGPAGVWQLVASGDAPAMAGVPDWGVELEMKGVKVDWLPANRYFPGMAQAVLASDDMIAKDPDTVRRFVQATLRGLKVIIDDPSAAADAFVASVPSLTGENEFVTRSFQEADRRVFTPQAVFGAMDPKALTALADFYAAQGIIQTKPAIDELYTNKFVTP